MSVADAVIMAWSTTSSQVVERIVEMPVEHIREVPIEKVVEKLVKVPMHTVKEVPVEKVCLQSVHSFWCHCKGPWVRWTLGLQSFQN